MCANSILLTGGTGFVGSALLRRLGRREVGTVVSAARSPQRAGQYRSVLVGDIDGSTDWSGAFESSIDVVIHAAARVHVMHERGTDSLSAFRSVNVEGTLHLARQAINAKVKRFIYISSIKVNGEATQPGQPFTADDIPAPQDPYGVSKHEAEQGLLALASSTGMEVVIIRPVLVYGPGVGANMLSMMRWLFRGVPLPLGALDNRRSLVAVDNLADLIVTCLDHPSAINQIFLVSDGEDVSTTELLRRVGTALGQPARLLPIPPLLLQWIAGMSGKRAFSQRLLGSLQVDIEKNRRVLGWSPPVTLDQELGAMAQHFRQFDHP